MEQTDNPLFVMEFSDGSRFELHPTQPDIAEALLYQAMRGGLMQQALDEYAK